MEQLGTLPLALLQSFHLIARSRGFAAAARQLRVQRSTVTRHLQELEEILGQTLVLRTTRKFSLTHAGRELLEKVDGPLSELAALSLEEGALREARGRLRMTAPVSLGEELLGPLLAAFAKRFPEVRVEVVLEDRVVDLVGEGYDLAIRSGSDPSPTLAMRKLGESQFSVYAAPLFLKRHPLDSSGDWKAVMEALPCIEYWPHGEPLPWILFKGDRRRTIRPGSPTRVNSLRLAKALCVAGSGLALLPDFLCQVELRQGRLVNVLPGWKSEDSSWGVVTSVQRARSPLIRAFIELAEKHLVSTGG